MLHKAEGTMRAIVAEELKHTQIESKYPLQVRIGIAIAAHLKKSGSKLDQLIKAWPGAQVGYATRESIDAGLKFLAVKTADAAQHAAEVDVWYNSCYAAGLAASTCRPGGGICLKIDLPPTLAMAKREEGSRLEREARLRESKQAALIEQEEIRARAKEVAKSWAAQGAAALKAAAETVAAQELSRLAKLEAQQQRREAAKRRISEKRHEQENTNKKPADGEKASQAGGRKVNNERDSGTPPLTSTSPPILSRPPLHPLLISSPGSSHLLLLSPHLEGLQRALQEQRPGPKTAACRRVRHAARKGRSACRSGGSFGGRSRRGRRGRDAARFRGR